VVPALTGNLFAKYEVKVKNSITKTFALLLLFGFICSFFLFVHNTLAQDADTDTDPETEEPEADTETENEEPTTDEEEDEVPASDETEE